MCPRLPKTVLPTSRFETEAAAAGAKRIAGIDEAGRGPLAGPVVAAAVVLRSDRPISYLNDSKLLTESRREELFREIREKAAGVGIAVVEPDIIDRINILQATRLAMCRAVDALTPLPDYLLIDGPISLDMSISQKAIIQGDQLSLSIAAAGIVAKVTRDGIMRDLHRQYPLYGFDRHKGYGTAIHRAAIAEHGPCPIHRMCFRGVLEPVD